MKEENVYEVGDLVVCIPSMAKAIGIHIHLIGIVTGTVLKSTVIGRTARRIYPETHNPPLIECMFGSQTIPLMSMHIKHLEET